MQHSLIVNGWRVIRDRGKMHAEHDYRVNRKPEDESACLKLARKEQSI